MRVIGLIIGILCGILELLLLVRVIPAVSAGESARVAFYMLLKFLVLAAAFVPVLLYFKNDLLWCGVGVSLSLVLGSFVRFLVKAEKQKKQKEGEQS